MKYNKPRKSWKITRRKIARRKITRRKITRRKIARRKSQKSRKSTKIMNMRSHKKNTSKHIIDPPLSDNKLLGTLETLGSMNYFYQKYSNIFKFFKIIDAHNKNDDEVNLANLCMPNFGNINIGSFAAIRFNLDKIYSSKNPSPSDTTIHIDEAINKINKCLNDDNKAFTVLSYQIISIKNSISHANSLIFDNVKKTVELFEPHTSLTDNTTMEGIVGAYKIINDSLKKFLNNHFKHYRYIPPSEYLPSYGLQINYDAYNGLCVTWNILYIHYKLLNPNIDSKKLVRHIDSYFNVSKILRYGKYVKEMLKLGKKYNIL